MASPDPLATMREQLAAAQAEAHDYREALENEFPADIPSGYRAHTPKAIVAVLSRPPGSREALRAMLTQAVVLGAKRGGEGGWIEAAELDGIVARMLGEGGAKG